MIKKEIIMKWIHLSDLHIGKRVNEISMIDDQKYILQNILDIIEEKQVEGVILAGDIYDKPIPSAEAVQVLDDFLSQLSKRNLSTYMISGNHDSMERLSFASSLLKNSHVYISNVFNGIIEPIITKDNYGEIAIYLLPYKKPAMVRPFYEEEIQSYNDAIETIMKHITIEKERRNILVSHQFVTGAITCDSEEISVGGMDNVDSRLFEAFDYVALGHIHGAQSIGRETIRYCGTPLKYSFSEEKHVKTATIIDMKEKGNITIEEVPLIPKRDMRTIKGSYEFVTAKEHYKTTNVDDYIHITLTDEEDIVDVMAKLRTIYPNLMSISYDNKRTRENQKLQNVEKAKEKTPIQLFEELYQVQNNSTMSEEQIQFITKLMEDIWEHGGEN